MYEAIYGRQVSCEFWYTYDLWDAGEDALTTELQYEAMVHVGRSVASSTKPMTSGMPEQML